MAGLLQGKTILVTGAAQPGSIGAAIAERCAEQGARVALTSRSADAARAAAQPLGGSGHGCDLTRDDHVTRLAADVLAAHGRVDGIIHNAGLPISVWDRPFLEVPLEDYRRAFEVDVLGAARLTKALLPAMIEQGGGALVFTSSTAALAGYESLHEFAPAKAGVLGLMRGIASEMGRRQVRANAIAYGNIASPATWNALDDAQRRALALEAPMRRWAAPREAAGAAVFLVSDLASFVSGQTLVVDGGTVMR